MHVETELFIELSLSPSKAAVKAVTVVVAEPAEQRPRLKKFRSCQGGHAAVSTALTGLSCLFYSKKTTKSGLGTRAAAVVYAC